VFHRYSPGIPGMASIGVVTVLMMEKMAPTRVRMAARLRKMMEQTHEV